MCLLGNQKLNPLSNDANGFSKNDWFWLKPQVASDFTDRDLGIIAFASGKLLLEKVSPHGLEGERLVK